MSFVALFLLLLALLFFAAIGGVYLALLAYARVLERRRDRGGG